MNDIPTYLKHKPVVVWKNYESVDGKYADNTDAKGLSIGLAQWNDRGSVDISAKIWRYTGEKWSRQSEEMPLHRSIDLVFLITQMMMLVRDKNALTPTIQGKEVEIALCLDNTHLTTDLELLKKFLADNEEILSARFSILAENLRQLGF